MGNLGYFKPIIENNPTKMRMVLNKWIITTVYVGCKSPK